MPLNVMLVEDQALIRMGIELAVQQVSNAKIKISSVAENGEQAVKQYVENKPDVVLMDIRMPVMGGLEASRQIRSVDKNAKIIFLTNNDSIDDVFSAFSIGASGYCLKDVEPSTLVDFIKNANDGGISIDSRIAADMLRFLTSKDAMPDLRATAQMYNGTRLNARDAEVLSQLVHGSASDKMSVNTKLSVINILNKIATLSDGESNSREKEDLNTTEASERFEFIEILGKGGMGTVFKARNKSTDTLVAVKVFKPTTTSAWQRFVQEASIMTKLSHRSVVKVFDFLLDRDRTAYLVMELVDGPSLLNVIECGGAIVQKEAVPIFVQCSDALEHLHRAGVVHRDIKPSNIILFCEDETTILPKIVDFGVSKCMAVENSDRLTLQGEVLGSPLYMSPEQCRGEDVTPLSDIYSMGCVMFEVLCGCPPFVGESYFETMAMHSRSPVPNLREWMNVKHELSPELGLIIEKCLAKAPKDRFQTAEELAVALDKLRIN
ncbi:protein kinase [Candidatus Obscuribacterales bacterium]|nr:protein kinase [Candidatus Obscuribacterales bacterium]